MVDFVQLQHLMKERLEQDRTVRLVEAHGPTLEAAAAEAAVLLNLPVRRLEYEITEKGSPGFLGTGRKDWKIRAYQRAAELSVDGIVYEEELVPVSAAAAEDKDGGAFVFAGSEGVLLRVTAPQGKGKRASESHAMRALSLRGAANINSALVNTAIKEASGLYVRVGDFEHNPMNDASVTVDIVDQDMRACITVTPPGRGGGDMSLDEIKSALKTRNVVFGIKEDAMRDFVDQPVYGEMVMAAEGEEPVDGRDAYIQYNFGTDQSKAHIKEGYNGQVDFKELNIIQNVVEGQPLARKIEAGIGAAGKTVTGKIIPAQNGRDIAIPLGKNVRLGDDGLTVIAEMNGQVMMIGDKINVESVFTVEGNVNLKTGNIIFLGTVIITGNVEAGFSVKAAGNIEVRGIVEKAELDAEGDIIVQQGITGRSNGMVRAGRSVWARFIENALVDAGDMVVATDGIINSQVDAGKRIICQGKRANIVGGRFRATEEINAQTLGSPTSGTETICEVGFDPKSKEKLVTLGEQKAALEKEFEEIQHSLQTLINIKKQRKSLPEEKEASMKELTEKRQNLNIDIQKVQEDMEKVQDHLDHLTVRGKVSASNKVHPGVKVVIRDIRSDVKAEHKAVTFVLENGIIRINTYEEPGEDITRGPDGHTAN